MSRYSALWVMPVPYTPLLHTNKVIMKTLRSRDVVKANRAFRLVLTGIQVQVGMHVRRLDLVATDSVKINCCDLKIIPLGIKDI